LSPYIDHRSKEKVESSETLILLLLLLLKRGIDIKGAVVYL
jgi:hypothetical protein